MTRKQAVRAAIVGGILAAYVTTVVAANVITNHYGFVSVGFGLTTTAGTYAAGVALLARDALQDTSGRRAVLVAIVAGAVLSAWFSTPQLAFASGVAFLIAELSDMAIYTPLRKRGWARAVLASNMVGAALDTVTFLWLAGFPIWAAAPGQLVGKVLWATVAPVLAVLLIRTVRRAVPRYALGK